MLRDKGFKARALLGGFPAWEAAKGEVEPITEAERNVPQQNTNPRPAQTGIVASPNPTADERQAKPSDAPKTVEGAPVQPTATTSGAPMKTTKSKRSKRQKTKPSGA